jgi:hypothetical protein
MKIDINDVRRMTFSFAVVAVCGVIGLAATTVSWQQVESSKKLYLISLNTQKELRAKLSRANGEQEELRGQIARYQQLDTKGYIGDEHRLNWIEKIRSIKQQRKLLDVQYELQPQQLLETAVTAGSPGGDIEFMSSMMTLRLMMLHEEDLANFITDLSATVDAIIRVRQCNVERISNPTTQAQLVADCTIEWITIRPKSAR